MYLKESCFPDCWKVSSVVLVFKNVEERSTAKNYLPVNLLSVESKVFQKLAIGLLIIWRNVSFFLICSIVSSLPINCRSSNNCIWENYKDFNKSGATRALTLDTSKAFNRVWHASLLHKLNFMEFQVSYLTLFCHFSVRDSFKWFWMGRLRNIHLKLELLQAPFLDLHFF